MDGSWSVGDTFTPSEVAVIISTKPTDCPGMLGIKQANSDIVLDSGLNLTKGNVSWGNIDFANKGVKNVQTGKY